MMALLPALISAQGADTNQQWVGPDDTSKGTIIFRPLVSVQIWKCFDLPGGDTTNGNHIQIWDCNEKSNQQWKFDGMYIRYNATGSSTPDKCIDLPGGGDAANGAKLQIWDCECRIIFLGNSSCSKFPRYTFFR
jgi:hypothetical protein